MAQMNRAFSAGRFLFTGELGAMPQASMTIAPLVLNRHRKGEARPMSVCAGSRSSPLHLFGTRVTGPFFKLVEEVKSDHAIGLVNVEAEPRVFTTTRWSLVLAGANAEGDQQNKAAEALAELCRTYWRPAFSY